MIALLRVVPLWAWALATVIAWGAWQRLQANRAAADLAAVHTETARLRERGVTKSLEETQRRLTAQQEAAEHAAEQARKAASAAAARRVVSRRVRAYADGLAASAAACHPAAAAVGQAASAPAVVLADLLGRLEARAGDLAEFADARGIAGSECAARYDTLTASPR